MLQKLKGLEIGGEKHPAYPDYDQLDNVDDWGADIICDARDLRKIPPDTYDHVYARNVLEHFSWRITKDVLTGWLRVVKCGGYLEVIVPDTLGIINDYISGKNDWSHCCERLAGTQDYKGNTHLAFFTFDEFEEVLPDGILYDLEQTHAGGGITSKIYKTKDDYDTSS